MLRNYPCYSYNLTMLPCCVWWCLLIYQLSSTVIPQSQTHVWLIWVSSLSILETNVIIKLVNKTWQSNDFHEHLSLFSIAQAAACLIGHLKLNGWSCCKFERFSASFLCLIFCEFYACCKSHLVSRWSCYSVTMQFLWIDSRYLLSVKIWLINCWLMR